MYNMDSRHRILFSLILAVHTAEQNLDFLQKCIKKKLLPSFTRFSRKFLENVNWSKVTLERNRFIKLEKAAENATDIFITKKAALNSFINTNLNDLSHVQKRGLISEIKRKVKFHRTRKDKSLFSKLKKLESLSNNVKGLQRDVLNFTDCVLPNKVKKILSKGPSGGSPRMTTLMVNFERLLKHWTEYAKSIKVDPFRLWTYKTKISGFVEKFSKCWEKNDFKQVSNFFDQNPNLKCVKVDKTSAFAVIYSDEYNEKLEKEFKSNQFVKLKNDPLDTDLRNFSSLLIKLKPYVSTKTYFSLNFQST